MAQLPKQKKKTVFIKSELCEWVDEQVKNGKYEKFNHAIEVALEKLRESEKVS